MKIQIAAEKCFWIYHSTVKVIGLPPPGSLISIDDKTNFKIKWYYYRGEKDFFGRLIPRAVGDFIYSSNEAGNQNSKQVNCI